MVTRIHFEDEGEANEFASKVDDLGHEVAVINERFAGEDDDEAVEYVVCTPASRAELFEAFGDELEAQFVTED